MPTIEGRCPCWENLLSHELCSSCLKALQRSLLPRSISFRLDDLEVFSMSSYEPCMKDYILSCKNASFNGLMPSQKKLLIELCDHWAQELRTQKIQKVVPIPAHPLRSLMQSDLAWFLARYLSRSLSLGDVESLLKRRIFIKDNFYSPQKTLSAFSRKEKISEQYYVPRNKEKNLRVLLVDDVCTTGSTLKYCKKILQHAGYEVAGALVLSKVSENKKTGAPLQGLRYL